MYRKSAQPPIPAPPTTSRSTGIGIRYGRHDPCFHEFAKLSIAPLRCVRRQSLTRTRETPTLTTMYFGRGVVAALSVALAAYGVDCMGMATPEHTMSCCEKMRCHSHHHHNSSPQNCCKTTPQMQASLGQPSSMQTISVSPGMFGVMQAFDDPKMSMFFGNISARHSHDPPLSGSLSTLPLRI